MRLYSLIILTHCILVTLAGCGERQTSGVPSPATSATSTSNVPISPHHLNMELFTNLRTSPDVAFDNKDGCTTSFSPTVIRDGAKLRHGSECGFPGAVSRVNFEYTRSDGDGDHYHFERLFPYGEPDQKSTQLDVVFTGRELVLFEDEWQRVVLRSKLLGH